MPHLTVPTFSHAPFRLPATGDHHIGSRIGGGWKDDQLLTGSYYILTPYHDPSPAGDATENPPGGWNISKGRLPGNPDQTPPPFEGDMHTLMYGGNYSLSGPATKIVVQLQGWFCNGVLNEGDCSAVSDYTPDGGYQYVNQYYGHADVQYTGWNPDVANARVIDIWDRGGDTLATDWYGGPKIVRHSPVLGTRNTHIAAPGTSITITATPPTPLPATNSVTTTSDPRTSWQPSRMPSQHIARSQKWTCF